MSSVLNEMLKLLSDEDKIVFEQLSEKLKKIDGDLSQLSDDEKNLIQQMERKYGDQINQTHDTFKAAGGEFDILATPFAQHVRQILARDLGEQFPEEAQAIQFAFDNKWMPVDCQDESLALGFYERFSQDINEANQWREDLVGVDSDKKMAVGLAWFMVIFKLQEQFGN